MHEKVTIGNCTLYLGDCREILPTLPRCDLLLTDPPYGIGAYKTGTMGAGVMAKQSRFDKTEWDAEPVPDWMLGLMAEKAESLIIFGGNYYRLPPTSCVLVWDKDNGENNFADCELAWTNLKKAVRIKRYRWQGMLQEQMGNRKEERYHPTQKPVPVMEWCLSHAPDAKTVLDPFMGSGTTGVACVKTGRHFVGIEREPKYFEIACKRIEAAAAQGDLFIHPNA